MPEPEPEDTDTDAAEVIDADDDAASVAVPLDTDMVNWLTAYRRAKDKEKHWAATAKAAQRHITELLDAAGADLGTVNGHIAVRWKTFEARRIDGIRLRAERPDLADLYSKVDVRRRFTTLRVPNAEGPLT